MLPAQSTSAFSMLKAIITTVPDPVVILTKDGTIQCANRATKKLFQYGKHELQGRHVSYLFSGDTPLNLQSYLDAQKPFSGVVHNLHGRCKDGTVLPLGISLSKQAGENDEGIIATFYDDTQARLAEERIKSQGIFSRKCLSNTNYLFSLVKASNLEILKISDRVRTILGYEPEDLVGRSFMHTIHPDDKRYLQDIFQSIVKQYPEPFLSLIRFRRVHKSGDFPVMEVSISCVKDQITNELFFVTASKDITVYLSEEERTIQKVIAKNHQENQGIMTVAALILHELRNPLTGIQCETEMMKSLANSSELLAQTTKTETSCSMVSHLLSTFLTVSQIQAGKFELTKLPYSLNHLVSSLFTSVGAQTNTPKAIQLNKTIANGLPDIQIGDFTKFYFVLETLCRHSLSLLETGESLTLSIRPNDPTNEFILFQLTDSRPTISQQEKEFYELLNDLPAHQIFLSEVFTSLEEYIHRLDLVVCKSIVQLMRGSLHFFYDKPPYGFVCQLVIPNRAATDPRDILRFSAALALTTYEGYFKQLNLKVLCVDDNASNNKVMKKLWQKLGCEDCDTAISGKEALERIRRKKFDVIILDYMMPEMNGKELAQAIRVQETGYRSIILLCSGLSLAESSEECKKAGVDAFIIKPPTVAMLAEACVGYLFSKADQGSNSSENQRRSYG